MLNSKLLLVLWKKKQIFLVHWTDPNGDAEALRDYFNLETRLGLLAEQWARRDARFAAISPYFPGAVSLICILIHNKDKIL